MKKTLLLLALLSPAALAQTTPFVQQPFERAVVDLLNEVRTKGTLQGSTAIRSGTCVQDFGALGSRGEMVYHPALNLAGRKHAQYIVEEWNVRRAAPDFDQRNRRNTHFYGTTVAERSARAAQELGVAAPVNSYMYIRTGPAMPAEFVRSLLEDREVCLQLTAPLFPDRPAFRVGAGYHPGLIATPEFPNPWGSWILLIASR